MNDRPDLLSLVLYLRPIQTRASKPLPLWWGRSAHALYLKTIAQYNPPLAERLHAEQGPHPFTASTLMGSFPEGQLDRDYLYRLRLTAFQQDLAAVLLLATQTGNPLEVGAQIELDYIPFTIERTETGNPLQESPLSSSHSDGYSSVTSSNPWAACTTYQELSAALLLAKEPAPRRINLHFTSPTAFKSGGMHVPIPLAELAFGSLLERWNAYAPIAFPAETKRYAAECLAIGRYRLSSRPTPTKGRGLRVGAIGQVSYVTLNYDRYWMSVIGVLAAFALFSGVGVSTSIGMGQCRQVEDIRRRKPSEHQTPSEEDKTLID